MICYGYPGYLVTHGNGKLSALAHRIEKCNDWSVIDRGSFYVRHKMSHFIADSYAI
ncbi:hypothetical protein FWK35_00007397 [Aphis craccivora]|uniref:Uncharacterized protein n=1 Tax=Aphis craccivora TaxID=307492 RepID=A0A6G0Z9X8_APHCR|nr:hypothetical protein FWK35_00007397 [Aphis craccivora]